MESVPPIPGAGAEPEPALGESAGHHVAWPPWVWVNTYSHPFLVG